MIPSYPDFSELTLDIRGELDPLLREYNEGLSEFTFTRNLGLLIAGTMAVCLVADEGGFDPQRLPACVMAIAGQTRQGVAGSQCLQIAAIQPRAPGQILDILEGAFLARRDDVLYRLAPKKLVRKVALFTSALSRPP